MFQAAPRAGLKVPAGFAGTVKATAKPAAAVDLSHQTLAVRHGARTFAFRRSLPALPVSGVGLDDPACRGAEGGHAVAVAVAVAVKSYFYSAGSKNWQGKGRS